jgi:transposase InsO family protein
MTVLGFVFWQHTNAEARPIRCCSSKRLSRNFPSRFQRIQTDRGREFFAYAFQEKAHGYGIKFRSLKPASPHLNGKVERSQRTDLEEFYATVDLSAKDLAERLDDWQIALQRVSSARFFRLPHTLASLVGAGSADSTV